MLAPAVTSKSERDPVIGVNTFVIFVVIGYHPLS